jgi:hypothetical protein
VDWRLVVHTGAIMRMHMRSSKPIPMPLMPFALCAEHSRDPTSTGTGPYPYTLLVPHTYTRREGEGEGEGEGERCGG